MFYDYNWGLVGRQTGNKPWNGIKLIEVSFPNDLQMANAENSAYNNGSSGYIDAEIESEKRYHLSLEISVIEVQKYSQKKFIK